jgi:hypothetical protein
MTLTPQSPFCSNEQISPVRAVRSEKCQNRKLGGGRARLASCSKLEMTASPYAFITSPDFDGSYGIPANRNPRMRRPRIDRFAYQL